MSTLRRDPAKLAAWRRRSAAKARRNMSRTGLEREHYATERVACFDAAGGRCQVTLPHRCTGRATEAHHVLRRRHGGIDDRENLLAACANGHATIHSNPAAAYEAGHLTPPPSKA